MALTREAGFGAEVKRRIILGTYALSSGYYDAYYGSGAEGADPDQPRLRRGLRAGRRAGLAVHAGHRVPDRGEGRRPAGHVHERPLHDPVQPGRQRQRLLPGRAGAGGRPAGRAAGDGAAAGRRPALPGGRRAGAGARRRSGAARCWTEIPEPGGPRDDRERPLRLVAYDDALERYDPVMGLEVHVELNTASKMFCGCSTVFGAEPNTQVCPVCLGLPGLAAGGERHGDRVGDPDRPGAELLDRGVVPVRAEELLLPGHAEELPDLPVRRADRLRRLGRGRGRGRARTYRIEIERAHMEEDTGKSLHVGGATGRIHGADHSLLDYNRSGVPLIEIVTKPIEGAGDKAPEVARAYVTHAARPAARARASPTSGWSRARCAATPTCRCGPIARTRRSAPGPRPRTSTRCAASSGRSATRSPGRRRCSTPAAGSCRRPGTGTRTPGVTTSGRSKETAEDYRYFPEPDLVPIAPSREWVEELRGDAARAAGRRGCGGSPRSGASPTSSCGTWSTPARST